jgi:hypothetical protein
MDAFPLQAWYKYALCGGHCEIKSEAWI